jgi:hypothetical protein
MEVFDHTQDARHQSARPARILLDTSLSSFDANGASDRHLLFVDPDLDIHLKITESGSKKEICGQVIPRVPVDRDAPVTLSVRGELLQATTATDDSGEFRFDNVPTGNVIIEIFTAPHHVITAFDA